jgi:hypothetical protein
MTTNARQQPPKEGCTAVPPPPPPKKWGSVKGKAATVRGPGDKLSENRLPLLDAYRFVFSRKLMHDDEAMLALKTWQPAMFELIMDDIEKENRIMKPPAHE